MMTECWIFEGHLTENGYGQANVNGRRVKVHRAAYEVLVGPVPEGLDLDHLCRRRACYNPMHLEPVTRAENLRRGREARKAFKGNNVAPCGSHSRYVTGCRCQPCKSANAEYFRSYRNKETRKNESEGAARPAIR